MVKKNSNLILAIDLGKFNSMCCSYDPQSQEARFQRVPTDRGYLRSFLSARGQGMLPFLSWARLTTTVRPQAGPRRIVAWHAEVNRLGLPSPAECQQKDCPVMRVRYWGSVSQVESGKVAMQVFLQQ